MSRVTFSGHAWSQPNFCYVALNLHNPYSRKYNFDLVHHVIVTNNELSVDLLCWMQSVSCCVDCAWCVLSVDRLCWCCVDCAWCVLF